jgi:diaminopimelate decarboxylase
MRAHEAGALHGQAGDRGPAWLRVPEDPDALVPHLWASGVSKVDGVLTVAGESAPDLAEEFGTPLYVVDEDDFRSRCRAFRTAMVGGADAPGGDVFYAGKAFLSLASVRWVAEEGLGLDVCTGGELAVALRAGFPVELITFHGNNKSMREIERAIDVGVARFVVDSLTEIERIDAAAAERGVRARVAVRVNVGVEAHTHEYIATAHEDQKFGFSLADGVAADAVAAVLGHRSLELVGLHAHVGSQIFDSAAFEVSARRLVDLHAAVGREYGHYPPEMGLGGGFGVAYTTQDDPQPVGTLIGGLRLAVAAACASAGVEVPRLSIEPGRAIAGPAACTLYEVGTVQTVRLDGGGRRTYVSVDGGMSDNIRPALYGAAYSCALASRASMAPPMLARVVGKHCEAGDVVVQDDFLPADIGPGDLLAVPGTGAYCRAMASNYNHVPRPAVVAVRDGTARLIIRREEEDDLLRLDVG